MKRVSSKRMLEILQYLESELNNTQPLNLLVAGILITKDFDDPKTVTEKLKSLNSLSDDLNLDNHQNMLLHSKLTLSDFIKNPDSSSITTDCLTASVITKPATEKVQERSFETPKPVENPILIDSNGESESKHSLKSKSPCSESPQRKQKLFKNTPEMVKEEVKSNIEMTCTKEFQNNDSNNII